MAILIGGSPSTGSSLLRRVLNRHSQVFCGSETSIFSKEKLYTDWSRYKSKLISRSFSRLLNAGWHHYRSIDVDSEYILSKESLLGIVESSQSFPEFSEHLYARTLAHHGKTVWAEKTPSNAFTMQLFLDTFPDSKVVHITRDPLDCIASLVNRGMDVYNAICVYMMNTSKALEVHSNPSAYLIKYEDLTQQPEQTIKQLMAFLGLSYESSMLEPDEKPQGVVSMKGWQYKETDAIKSKAIGRFFKLSSENQKLILSGLKLLSCTCNGEYTSVIELAARLDYSIPVLSDDVNSHNYFLKSMRLDKLQRKLKRSYFSGGNYPIRFKNED